MKSSLAQRAQDQRRFGRRATAIHATVEVENRPLVSGVIRNLSEGGALLELIDKTELPESFWLRLHDTNAKLLCELTRKSGNAYGVAFKAQGGNVAAIVRKALDASKEPAGV